MRPFTPRELVFSAPSAGFAGGLLFCLSAVVPGGVFLAILPLMMVGFAQGARQTRIACGIACIMIGAIAGLEDAVFFACFFALPVYYFVQRALFWRGAEQARTWYPTLTVICEITIMTAAYFMVLAFATEAHGGLKALVQNSSESFRLPDPEIAVEVKQTVDGWGFGILAGAGWFWVVLLYALAVLSNAIVRSKRLALRPSLALETHGLSGWLLFLVALSGLFAIAGQGMDRYTAQAVFLLLLLPYFLCGVAFVHLYSIERQLYARRLWITCFYVALVFGRWPALPLIAIGLYFQLAEMLDRRKKMG